MRTSRRMRGLVSVVGVGVIMLITALPASAVPPVHLTFPFSGEVSDSGEACGFPLSWEFTGEVRLTRFFNQAGDLIRVQAEVRESGTVTNLDTGEVIVLPLTAFVERVLFRPDGSTIIEDVGLSVRVTGPDEMLLDVGRFVVSLDPNELLQSAGQHPIREINPFSVSDPALLGAFCSLFD